MRLAAPPCNMKGMVAASDMQSQKKAIKCSFLLSHSMQMHLQQIGCNLPYLVTPHQKDGSLRVATLPAKSSTSTSSIRRKCCKICNNSAHSLIRYSYLQYEAIKKVLPVMANTSGVLPNLHSQAETACICMVLHTNDTSGTVHSGARRKNTQMFRKRCFALLTPQKIR